MLGLVEEACFVLRSLTSLQHSLGMVSFGNYFGKDYRLCYLPADTLLTYMSDKLSNFLGVDSSCLISGCQPN